MGLYLVGLAFLGGLSIVANRVPADPQQMAVISQDDRPVREGDSNLVPTEQLALAKHASSDDPWTAHIRRMDDALAQTDISAAEQTWREAYGAALRSRRWDGLVAVGDASLRIAEVVGAREAPKAKARRLYLAALFRARDQGSLDGVLRSTEAFAALGDHEVAVQGVRIAEDLAARGRDAQAQARVRVLGKRVTARLSETENRAADPY
jgi:hypothetical protein